MNEKNGVVKRIAGFTLLEVVIAITIFAVCVSIVYSLYGSVISVVNNVEDQVKINHGARIALDRMAQDLTGIYTGNLGYIAAQESAAYHGDDPVLSLTSTAHMVLDPKSPLTDIAVIRYYIKENDEGDDYTLLRSDTPVLGKQNETTDEGTRHILSSNVIELSITYIGAEGEESETWDSGLEEENDKDDEDRFPKAFRISLALGDGAESEDNSKELKMTLLVSPQIFEFEVEP